MSRPVPEELPKKKARKSGRSRGKAPKDPVAYTVSSLEEHEGEMASRAGKHAKHAEAPARQPRRFDVDLDESRIDSDAAKVVQRLVRHGYEAYLVGGCVRDLLLGHQPKDFDVATSAKPETVRGLFRNSRVIGRRFRLVHVLFSGRKVIETATFRRSPPPGGDGDDLLIRDDNAFGRADEDAERRDFTINALFFDIEGGQVLDWCDGMADVRARAVRTIGDPVVRFREDPVRMLRAIKFCARLDLGIEPETYRALVQCRGSLAMAARPRLFEEVLRLLRGGKAHRSYWLTWETGVLDVLIPELSAYLYDAVEGEDRVWALLDQLDAYRSERGESPDDIVLLATLLLEPLREVCAGEKDRLTAARDFLEPLVQRLAMPRRIADAIARIMSLLPRLEAGSAGKLPKTPLYPFAMDVLRFSEAASPGAELFACEYVRPARRRRSKSRGSASTSSGE